jgi:hypothetical protein
MGFGGMFCLVVVMSLFGLLVVNIFNSTENPDGGFDNPSGADQLDWFIRFFVFCCVFLWGAKACAS